MVPSVIIWYLNGTLPIKQPTVGVYQGWHYLKVQSTKMGRWHEGYWEEMFEDSTWKNGIDLAALCNINMPYQMQHSLGVLQNKGDKSS